MNNCSFCGHERRTHVDDDYWTVIYLCGENLMVFNSLGNGDGQAIRIKHCPICGRKLGEGKGGDAK